MKALILYASTYGLTQEMAKRIQSDLSDSTQCINLNKESAPALDGFDTIILGSSIYVGQIQKAMKTYLLQNKELLMQKRLGIFLCCGFEHEFENHLKNNFPQNLLDYATITQNLGGRIDLAHLSFAHKLLVKMIEKTEAGKRPILVHPERIQPFIQALQ